ncbi:hypothetical protein BDF14DRAFT_1758757 [Spinellus fusiger]|nr:hypothetical protein BDF14DRAFT_1758757 [Spinellus fusiger]
MRQYIASLYLPSILFILCAHMMSMAQSIPIVSCPSPSTNSFASKTTTFYDLPTHRLVQKRFNEDNTDKGSSSLNIPSLIPTLIPTVTSSSKTQVTTIIVDITTIIILETPSPNKVYHDINSDTYAHQQQDSRQQDSRQQEKDPNDENKNLTKQLEEDQQALRRMVTILSLVGGFGFVTIVAAVIVLVKIRINKRRKTTKTEPGATLPEQFKQNSTPPPGHSPGHSPRIPPRILPRTSSSNMPIESFDISGDDITTLIPIPSAPALMTIDQDMSYTSISHAPSRHIISLTSQTALVPSAPPAKELSVITERTTEHEGCQHERTNTECSGKPLPYSPHHSSSDPCPHCHHSSSEIPPPAYTPSEPFMYDVPGRL